MDLYIKTLLNSCLNGTNRIFSKDVEELKLIKRFYNQRHKKFYFIADMTESYDVFTPILSKVY